MEAKGHQETINLMMVIFSIYQKHGKKNKERWSSLKYAWLYTPCGKRSISRYMISCNC